jgi:hypothetical protein
MSDGEQPIIGLASATERDPNTSDRFSFWLAPGVIVNPFDIVEADQVAFDGTSRTFGIVTTLEHSTDAPTHLTNFISSNFGDVNEAPNTQRQGTTVAKAAVLSNNKDIYMPVRSEAPVRFATPEGIRVALGIDQIPEQFRIPAGLIEMSNGTRAVAYLDSRYILGPEGAHVNITGISGLATKTSYAIFLIQSILQRANAQEIGVIILNVKHGDLLRIDEPPPSGLDPEQHEMWEALGLMPKPFENVRYLLPWGRESQTTFRPNSFLVPENLSKVKLYAYSLRDTFDKLDLLLSQVPDPWDTLGALIGEIRDGLSDPSTGEWRPRGQWQQVQDWDSLLNGPPLVDQQGRAQRVGDVRAESVGRFRRIMRRIVKTRQSGLFVGQRSKMAYNLSQEIAKIRGGETIVVDIARLTDEEQTLVFGDILRTIYRLYAESAEEDEDLPEKVIIFVDELNKYAPARERESPIIEQILDIAERGRSLGVVLIGAEQFMSAVHGRVTGNCSTTVIGRTGSAELADSSYRAINQDVKANITRLQKGELVLSHAIYRQPIKIRFPKPAYRQEGVD